ncbi:MAG TPA: hydroxyethylthiazole kinase [Epulopiscium sp.]|nr:hydroxyethylthiazole kinase [Candidatus Epulonipiscium sp.]
MFTKYLENVREKCPLIHNITNSVTINDCANILLACGGSPIMADACEEVEEITSICGGLNINMGTLTARAISAMLLAGKKANEISHPVLLDPVGVGASTLRTETVYKLLKEVNFTVIRGNVSEIKTILLGEGTTKGVDADEADTVTEETLDKAIKYVKQLSKKTGAVIAMTGAIDIIADENKAYIIRNGHPMMSKISGTGCMLSAMTVAYVVANPHDILGGVAASVCAMGVCGEIAHNRLTPEDGNVTYRNYIIDAVYNLNAKQLKERANYEVR